jgi:hypothetical protein
MAKPSPHRAQLDGRAYLYSIQRDKGRIQLLELGISLHDTARFTLRREGVTDRFAKWVGLAKEWQTKDLDFDERVYIESEDSRLHDALSRDWRFRAGIRTLLTNTTVFRLEMRDGVLWVQSSHDSFVHGKGSDAEVAEKLARRVFPHLIRIGARLGEISARWENSRDPGWQRCQILLSVGYALGTAGLVSWFARPGPGFPHALQYGHIYTYATCTAAVGCVVLLGLVVALIGRESRTHHLLACMLFVATPGLWGLASVSYELINNTGMKQREEIPTIVEQKIRRTGRRHTHYLFQFSPLPPDGRFSKPVRVDYQTFESMPFCVHLDVRAGKLGDPWIAGVRPCKGFQLLP